MQTSINQMAADGTRISFVTSKSRELGRYMSDTLDEEWNKLRGMEIQAVGIASISYDEESQKLINLRNKGAMMGDPLVREGYVQSTIAEGLKNAGGNANGALAGFMGMGMGMQSSGSFMGAASNTNMAQMQMNQMPGGQWQGAAGMPYGQGCRERPERPGCRTGRGCREQLETPGWLERLEPGWLELGWPERLGRDGWSGWSWNGRSGWS